MLGKENDFVGELLPAWTDVCYQNILGKMLLISLDFFFERMMLAYLEKS